MRLLSLYKTIRLNLLETSAVRHIWSLQPFSYIHYCISFVFLSLFLFLSLLFVYFWWSIFFVLSFASSFPMRLPKTERRKGKEQMIASVSQHQNTAAEFGVGRLGRQNTKFKVWCQFCNYSMGIVLVLTDLCVSRTHSHISYTQKCANSTLNRR